MSDTGSCLFRSHSQTGAKRSRSSVTLGKKADVRTAALLKALEEVGYKGVLIGPSFVTAFFYKKQPRVLVTGGKSLDESAPALWRILDVFDASRGGGSTGKNFHMYGVIKGIFNQGERTFRVRHDPTEDVGIAAVTVPSLGDAQAYTEENEGEPKEKSQLAIECDRAGISVEEWKKRFGKSLPDGDESAFVTERERIVARLRGLKSQEEAEKAAEEEKKENARNLAIIQYYGE